MNRPERLDLLLAGGTVITMDPDRRILERGAVGVRGSRIAVVGPAEDLEGVPAARRLDVSGKVVFPGLVNTHTHLFQTLLKGPADDRVLEEWFREVVAPAASELTEEDCYVAAALGCVEALRSGTTTLKDFMYVHPRPHLSDAVIRAMVETGIRGVFVRGYIDMGDEYGIPRALIQSTEDVLADCERVAKRYHGAADGRITVRFGPCMIWSCTAEGLRATQHLAAHLGLGLTMHVAETPFSVQNAMARFGVGDLAALERLGVLETPTLAVHCVHLTPRDLRILKARGTAVSHNPTSNMYLAAGVAPVPQMLLAGIPVGLATDGPASNNNQNMIEALKFAALLHKVHTGDPTAITVEQVFEMATLGAARALGLEGEVGSLEVGKRADIAVADLCTATASPVHHPVSSLVYSAIGSEVETVIIDGRLVMEGGRILTVDEGGLLREAQRAAHALLQRARIAPPAARAWRALAF
ncbi:MAG: amidohydrolase [Armatimonadota bacterium]|nr:amidohydrolase [Armatimonadota bacterium]MDR7448560.1 amidohydrolase [Armatimonadota bacterium]MDR7458925.1 amidohydrolase [Armatimonadota bacterium]MDR7478928.1 amidohydrolase [Armatimonadota bacterium]MDR7488326.1 amidohydrolase [Armatimonadota bacterium]